MISDRLTNEVAAWLEFYRGLGIDDFLLEPRPAAVPQMRKSVKAAPSRPPSAAAASEQAPSPAATGAAPGDPAEFGAIAASAAPRTRETGAPRPPSAARSLSLFEAQAPPRAERETLNDIRSDLGDCQRCKLAGGRKNIVFGQGNPHAELVFVGEGPGADEDEQGLPFVGRAGQLLNRMLQLVGIRREDVYICNVVKCRPPGNRTPERDEVDACSPFLFRQIEAIRPRLVCCLGAPAVKTVLGIKEAMLKIRGRFYDFGGGKALAAVHPAYVLRNPREERILREDFEKIKDFLTASAKI
ncbi:MAG TPA: uracil-DNA glycosylase family protein [Terriglobia bacterium]|nr:uracil-DNA glycosylase family protein [Terriglobia bacterium]